MNVDIKTIRAWWSHRQGLDGSLDGQSPAAILARSGWARSVGGAAPYLTLFARAGTSRERADSALVDVEIHELPSARGCTYLVPASDYALALLVGQPFRNSEMNVARKLGVTDAEVDKLCAAVVKSLGKEALEPDQIRSAVGPAARNLGEEGKKKGITTTLPLALGKLQAEGEIRRLPVNGRIDQQRYKYARWTPNPLAASKLKPDAAYSELARRYFEWIGPATLAEFQWFSGLSGKAAKEAIEPLGLATLEDRLMFPGDLEKLKSFKIPKSPQYALVSSLDGVAGLRREIATLTDSNEIARLGGLSDLPNHAIFDRGTLVGLWDYDPTAEAIVWKSFIPKTKDLEKAVHRMEEFVRLQLGDARSFSLDSPKSRTARLDALR
jgi:Winged helix DNA-binding domain